MFVRELEEYADTLARKGALAYSEIAKVDPVGSFRFFDGVCTEASKIERSFPGFYATFCERLEVRKAEGGVK